MAELDDDYANLPHIPGGAQYPARWTQAAADFRAKMGARAALAQPYGDGARQAFDLFHPEGEAHGLCVFVHGGYWLKFHRNFWSHLAAGPLAHGWAVAMPSYDLCPDLRIADITRQISLIRRIQSHQIKRERRSTRQDHPKHWPIGAT